MRHYNTKHVGGGVRFSCIHCPHTVNTLDFAILNGNLRTQAAAAINQHSASEHVSKLFSFKPIVRGDASAPRPSTGPVWPRVN